MTVGLTAFIFMMRTITLKSESEGMQTLCVRGWEVKDADVCGWVMKDDADRV